MKLMRSNFVRAAASILVILGTITAFILYMAHHPSVGHQLSRISVPTFLMLLVLFLGTTFALTLVTTSTLRLCNVTLEKGESFLITAYSSIINFFGPLQSGPAFRGIYLKKKYNLKLLNYTGATFVYYFFYGLFSGLFLLSGLIHWGALALLVIIFLGLLYVERNITLTGRFEKLQIGGWWYVAGASLLQVSIMVTIYFIELHTISPGTSFNQAIVYAGAANLATFVSITPGAIGFRESFLVFSQNLHHVSNSTIVAANIIDRAMYLVLLGILISVIFGSHAQRRLKVHS